MDYPYDEVTKFVPNYENRIIIPPNPSLDDPIPMSALHGHSVRHALETRPGYLIKVLDFGMWIQAHRFITLEEFNRMYPAPK